MFFCDRGKHPHAPGQIKVFLQKQTFRIINSGLEIVRKVSAVSGVRTERWFAFSFVIIPVHPGLLSPFWRVSFSVWLESPGQPSLCASYILLVADWDAGYCSPNTPRGKRWILQIDLDAGDLERAESTYIKTKWEITWVWVE